MISLTNKFVYVSKFRYLMIETLHHFGFAEEV